MDCQSIPVDVCSEQPIQPLIESLLTVLKTEIDLQRELQGSLEEERRVLVRPDPDRLLRTNANKEAIILKALMLEEVITDIVKKISRMLAVLEREVTLSKLSEFAPPPLQTELQDCGKVLTSLVVNNRALNERNRDLLDMSLHLVNNSMRVITNLITANSDYIGTGERNPARMTGAVVCMRG